MYTAVDFDNKTNIAKVGRVASFLLTGLHRNTNYSIQVTSYGDKRFVESVPVSTTVQTDSNGELNKQILFLSCGNVKVVSCFKAERVPCLSNYAANLPSKLIQNSPDCDNSDKHIFFFR